MVLTRAKKRPKDSHWPATEHEQHHSPAGSSSRTATKPVAKRAKTQPKSTAKVAKPRATAAEAKGRPADYKVPPTPAAAAKKAQTDAIAVVPGSLSRTKAYSTEIGNGARPAEGAEVKSGTDSTPAGSATAKTSKGKATATPAATALPSQSPSKHPTTAPSTESTKARTQAKSKAGVSTENVQDGNIGPAPAASTAPSAPPPLPRAGSSFDPAAFPHLFDDILHGQSVRVLLALRSTCRALRDRVDAHAARHLVLKFKDKEKKVIHVVPHLFEQDVRFSALAGTWGDLDHWRPFLEHTRCLDLCGGVLRCLSQDDIKAFSRLDTLRIRGTPNEDINYSGFAAKTLVVLLGPVYDRNRLIIAPLARAPAGLKTMVVSAIHQPSEGKPPLDDILNGYDLPPSVENVVFIVTRRHDKKITRHQHVVCSNFHVNEIHDAVDSVAATVDRDAAADPLKCTFVDVAKWVHPTELFDAGAGDDDSAFRGIAIRKKLAALDPQGDAKENAFDHVHFTSATEYRKQVGDDEFRIETCAT